MATDSRKRIPSIRSVPESLADEEGVLDYLRDVHRLMRAVREGALAAAPAPASTGGSTPVPGPPGPIGPPGPPAPGTTPDLMPPPTPTGLTATAGFANIFIQWDVATYTQGRGNLQTNVYGAKYPGTGPLPTFSNAVLVGVAPQPDTIFILPTELGTQWHIWIKFQSRDGVESVSPAGGANGASATTGKIGNADLGPLIVEAGNLASGAVTATKLAAGAVEFTKFAAGLEPVGVVGSLPIVAGYTGPRTVVLTTDGKLYRLVSGAWTAAVPAADVSGQLTDAQIASIAAAKLTGQITGTQITDGAISTPKLAAGAVTAANIAADTITAAQIAANAITATELAAGAVTTAKLQAGAVTANELAANSVTSAKIQAGAVNTDQLAAGAVRTNKLLIAPSVGGFVNADPLVQDSQAWTFSSVLGSAPAYYPNFNAGAGLISAWDKLDGRKADILGPRFPVSAARTYQIESTIYQWAASGPTFYLGVAFYDADGALILGSAAPTGWPAAGIYHYYGRVNQTSPFGAAKYTHSFGANATAKIPPNAITASVLILGSFNDAGVRWSWGGAQVREIVPGELIVDGAITANKIAANAIAVGTAAIQNGAIVNAMIADATIDSAKIATLAAGKITAGSLGVGSFIQSNDYVSGVAGWRISGSGFAELGAASIRGQLTASQIGAWSISAGRAIIADGTINNAKIETLSAGKITAGNIQSGGYIRSTSYTPGSVGWSINADGTAEFGAASIRGKLAAGNLVGSASNSSRGSQSLALTSGAVQFQRYILAGFPLILESDPATNLARVEGLFEGDIVLLTNVSFSGGGGTYKAVVQAVFEFQVFDGSTWSTWANDNIVESSTTVILTGNEPIVIPMTLNDQLLLAPATYPQVRASVSVIFAGFRQLVVNGSAIKADALASATIRGRAFLRQRPN